MTTNDHNPTALAKAQCYLPISVIIPTYNRRQLLARAIHSVLRQSVQPLEIIVVDDGSTDGTGAWVQREFPSVILLEQENHGVSAARNRGIDRAQGEWIALLDADDVWLPTKLEQQWSAIQSGVEVNICHTEEQWIRNGKVVPLPQKFKKQSGYIFALSLRHCALSPSTVLLRREVLSDVGAFDESLQVCEDYDLWLRVTAQYPVCLVDVPLIEKHGGHADQLSTSTWGLDRFRARALYHFLQTAQLDAAQRVAAEDALAAMVAIVVTGARKHDNRALLDEFAAMLR